MAFLYISEFAFFGPAQSGQNAQIAIRPALTRQQVAISAGSTQSAAFGTQTLFIRVHTDAICCIAVGANPTAVITYDRMAADQTEYYGVKPGDKIAVIAST